MTDALKEYSGNYMTRPVHEEKFDPELYEPSSQALDVVEYQIEHGLEALSWWWNLSEAQRMEAGRALTVSYDRWNEER